MGVVTHVACVLCAALRRCLNMPAACICIPEHGVAGVRTWSWHHDVTISTTARAFACRNACKHRSQVCNHAQVLALRHKEHGRLALSTKVLEKLPGEMLIDPLIVSDTAEEMADLYRRVR